MHPKLQVLLLTLLMAQPVGAQLSVILVLQVTLAGASGDSDSESEAVSADAGCVVSYTASGSYY